MPSALEYSCVPNTLSMYLSFTAVLTSVINFITSPFRRQSLYILPAHPPALTYAQPSQGTFLRLSNTIKSLAVAAYHFFDEIIFQFVDICLWYTPRYRERASASWNSFSRNVKRRSSDMKTRVILAFRPASSFNLPVAVEVKDDSDWDFRDGEKLVRPMTWLLFDPVSGCVTPSGTPRIPRAQRTPSTPVEAAPLPLPIAPTLAQSTPPSVPLPSLTVPPLRKVPPSVTFSGYIMSDVAVSESSVESPSVYSSPPLSVNDPAQGELVGDAINVIEPSNEPDMDVVDMSPTNMLSVPELSASASDDSILSSCESVEMDISECNDYQPHTVMVAGCELSPILEQEEVCRISSATIHPFSEFPFGDIYRPPSYSKHVIVHEPSSSICDLDSSSNSSPSSCYSSAESSEGDFSSGTAFPSSDSRDLPVDSRVDIRRGHRRNGMDLGLGSVQGVNWWQELASSSRREPQISCGPQTSTSYGILQISEQASGLAIRLSSTPSEGTSRSSISGSAPAIAMDISENDHEDLELSSVDVDGGHMAACATTRPALNTHASWVTFLVPDIAEKRSALSVNLDLNGDPGSSSRPQSPLSSGEPSHDNSESLTSISTFDTPSAPPACSIPTSTSEPALITEAEARAAARRVSLHGKLPRLRNSTSPSYTVWDEVRRTRYIPSLTSLQQRRALADGDLQDSRRVGLYGKLPRERRRTGLSIPCIPPYANSSDMRIEAAHHSVCGPAVEQPESMAPCGGLRSLMLPARVGMRPFVGGPQPVPTGTPPVRF
ncbi:hypothetical protein D9619_001151 [Psilocybe cf. subviscida]|uniref:Uncharacterized protein n=1 Tax=Psilocybe cf. subviscida TaxID=2480587 RepID=A0A8H5F2J8_9AGAR|nr:hypothetical protein D9619_001151 [Psilocybe cf. subviscida]